MQKVSFFISSRHGQTLKIANYIKQQLEKEAKSPVLFEIHEISKTGDRRKVEGDSDLVIVGAPIYAKRFPRAMIQWVHANRKALEGKTSAFYSVSLNAVDERPECRVTDDLMLRKFLADTDWTPEFIASLGGALKYRSYNWWIRHLMKRISALSGGPTDTKRDFELTDWSVVKEFAQALAKSDNQSQFAVRKRLSQAFLRSHDKKKVLKAENKRVHV